MSIQLTIVTPAGEAFDASVDQAVLPGAEGEFGVLEQHERFLAPLQPGPLEIHTGGAKQYAAVTDGFADVSAQQLVVLVDRCDMAGDIDVAEAEADKSEAQAELSGLSGAEENDARRAELERRISIADIRIAVAGQA